MRFNFRTSVGVLLTLPAALSAQVPVADHHQHLFSPAAGALVSGQPNSPGISARNLIALLDSARIQRALVLSVAYTWGKASRAAVDNEYEHVKAENDWTAQQVAQYPDRLRAFCSFNPLKPYALKELERCSKNPQLRFGLKLHFGNSDVDLDNHDKVLNESCCLPIAMCRYRSHILPDPADTMPRRIRCSACSRMRSRGTISA